MVLRFFINDGVLSELESIEAERMIEVSLAKFNTFINKTENQESLPFIFETTGITKAQ